MLIPPVSFFSSLVKKNICPWRTSYLRKPFILGRLIRKHLWWLHGFHRVERWVWLRPYQVDTIPVLFQHNLIQESFWRKSIQGSVKSLDTKNSKPYPPVRGTVSTQLPHGPMPGTRATKASVSHHWVVIIPKRKLSSHSHRAMAGNNGSKTNCERIHNMAPLPGCGNLTDTQEREKALRKRC